jgi:hypothetical protein
LPTFLYDEREGWSDKDMKKGLLRGHILVRVNHAPAWHIVVTIRRH